MRRTLALFLLAALPLTAARNFQQTDNNGAQCSIDEALACSSLAVATSGAAGKLVDETGTAGVTEITNLMTNGDANALCVFFESDAIGDDTSWPSGTWTVRLNITTADAQSIVDARICRVDSTCGSPSAIGNDTTVTSLATTGVKTWSISGSAQSAATTDRFVVTFDCREDQAHGNSTTGWTPNQIIDTPLTAPAATIGGREGMLNNPITY